jgi:mono/diheme cytochrome c family protein
MKKKRWWLKSKTEDSNHANMKFSFLSISFLYFFLSINPIASAQDIPTDEPSLLKGKQLFLHNCYLCHEIEKEIIGPALVNIPQKRSLNWLISFIRNSQGMITGNDSTAAFLYEQYNHNVMPSFYRFSDEDILAILGYINKQSLIRSKENIYNGNEPGIILQGRQLFNDNCSHCHAVGHQIIGPGLASIPKTRTKPWLNDFIKNSQKVIRSGEPHANFLFKKFNNTKMPPFDFLSNRNIEAILLYIKNESEAPVFMGGTNGKQILSEDKTKITDFKLPKTSNVPHETPVFSKIALVFAGILLTTFHVLVGIKAYKNLNRRQQQET